MVRYCTFNLMLTHLSLIHTAAAFLALELIKLTSTLKHTASLKEKGSHFRPLYYQAKTFMYLLIIYSILKIIRTK